MKKILLILVSYALLFGAGRAGADLASSNDLIDRLSGMKTFSADFVQTVMDGRGAMLQSNSGKMAVQRPGLFYWQAHPPLEQLLVSDGRQLWSYDPDLEQVTVQEMDQRLTQTPALLLSGEVQDLAKSYEVTSVKISEKVWQFQLVPRDPDSLFENLRLTFADNILVQMHLLDSLGQRSSIEFSNVQVNPQLDASLFHFTPPEGVDVITQ